MNKVFRKIPVILFLFFLLTLSNQAFASNLFGIEIPIFSNSENITIDQGVEVPESNNTYDQEYVLKQLEAIERKYKSGIAPIIFQDYSVIGNEYFEITGLNETTPEDWSFVSNGGFARYNASTNEIEIKDIERFPQYQNYYLSSVTINHVAVVEIGTLKTSEFFGDSKELIYYVTVTAEDQSDNFQVSATILNEQDEVFNLNYKPVEFNVFYSVELDGKTILDSAESSYIDSYNNQLTLDTFFGADRPVQTTDRKAAINVNIPYGYTARIFSNELELTSGNPDSNGIVHNDGFPLGMDPKYVKRDDNKVYPDLTEGPSKLVVNDTFYNNDIVVDKHVIIQLTQKEVAEFSIEEWTKTDFAGGNPNSARGTSAKSAEPNPDNKGNLLTPISSQWNWAETSPEVTQMTRSEDGSYTFNHTWIFQTNAGESYFLDTLEINQVQLNIPLVPEEIGAYTSDGILISGTDKIERGLVEKADPSRSSKTTYLPDGTEITITYKRVFMGTNPVSQRVYIVDIKNARSDITVTGGNLFMSLDGAVEYSTLSLSGVYTQEDQDGQKNPAVERSSKIETWTNVPVSTVDINDEKKNPFYTDPVTGADIRFKLLEGYSHPVYYWETRLGESIKNSENSPIRPYSELLNNHLTVDDSSIYGPDAEGWYYFSFPELKYFTDNRFITLRVEAVPTKYIVEYSAGNDSDVIVDNLPEFNNNLEEDLGLYIEQAKNIDNNNGFYYDVTVNKAIAVSNTVPVDLNHESTVTGKKFIGWKAVNGTDSSEIITVGQGLELDNVIHLAQTRENYKLGNYQVDVIVLEPVWEETDELFNYYVFVEYKVPFEVEETISLDNVNWSFDDIYKEYFVEIQDLENDQIIIWRRDNLDNLSKWIRSNIPLDNIKTENDNLNGETLQVGINLDAPAFVNWLKNNPNYHFDPNQLEVYSVYNGDQINVRMVPTNGSLVITKNVEGTDDKNTEFEFEIKQISGDRLLNENFLGWSTDLEIDERDSENKQIIRFRDGIATVKLKDEEGITLSIPEGEYTVTEKEDIYNTRVVVNNSDFSVTKTINTQVTNDKENRVEFYNYKTPVNAISFTPQIVKTVEEKPAQVLDSTFTFKITPNKNYSSLINFPVENTVKIIGEGSKAFNTIEVLSAGVFEFTVEELDTDNYKALEKTHQLTVKVTNVEGRLEVVEFAVDNNSVLAEDNISIAFTNVYTGTSDDKVEPPVNEIPDDQLPEEGEKPGEELKPSRPEISKKQSTSGDRHVDKTDSYIEFVPGDIVTYYIAVTNTTGKEMTNVTIVDRIPDGLTYLEPSTSYGYSLEGNVLTWTFESLKPGERVEVYFSCKLPEEVFDLIYFRNTAFVNWNENIDGFIPTNEVVVGDPPKDKDEIETPVPNPDDFTNVEIPDDMESMGVEDTDKDQGNSKPDKDEMNSQVVEENKGDVTTTVVTTNTTKTVETTGVTSSPQTGIDSNIQVWILISLMAGIILVSVTLIYRRTDKEEESE